MDPAFDWLAYYAEFDPGRLAAVDLATRRWLTYRELDDRATRLATALRERFDPNHLQSPPIVFGLTSLRRVFSLLADDAFGGGNGAAGGGGIGENGGGGDRHGGRLRSSAAARWRQG